MYFAAFFFVVVGVLVMWICQNAYNQRLAYALHLPPMLEAKSLHASPPPHTRFHHVVEIFTKFCLRTFLFMNFIEEMKTSSELT